MHMALVKWWLGAKGPKYFELLKLFSVLTLCDHTFVMFLCAFLLALPTRCKLVVSLR